MKERTNENINKFLFIKKTRLKRIFMSQTLFPHPLRTNSGYNGNAYNHVVFCYGNSAFRLMAAQ